MVRILLFGLVLAALFLCAASSSSRTGLLLVANKDDQTLSLIDPDTGRQIATVPEGEITGHEVAVSPDGKLAFVPIYGNSGVGLPGTDGSKLAVIDISERRVIQTMDFGHGVRPHGAVFGPKERIGTNQPRFFSGFFELNDAESMNFHCVPNQVLYQAEPLPDVARRQLTCMRLDRLDPYYNIRNGSLRACTLVLPNLRSRGPDRICAEAVRALR